MYLHWDYFLALEDDLSNIARYIQFTEENYNVYSIELTRLILATCSEVDVVAKALCKKLDPTFSKNRPNIKDYRDTIKSKWPILLHYSVSLPKYGLRFEPWEDWIDVSEDPSPVWWRDHNSVKHDRAMNFEKANLENVINSMSGLFTLLLAFYNNENQQRELYPKPKLLTCAEYKPQELFFSDIGTIADKIDRMPLKHRSIR